MYGYIYKVTNIINKKIYIGQKKSKIFLGKNYLGSGKIIREAINKYGEDNFIVEMIDSADNREELDAKERYWIAKNNATDLCIGYNLAEGGEGGNTTSRLSIDRKKLIEKKRRNTIFNKYKYLGANKNKIIVNNGIKNKMILKQDLAKFLDEGWLLGGKKLNLTPEERINRQERNKQKKGKSNKNKGKIVIHKNNQIKRINKNNLNDYLINGWILGGITGKKVSLESRIKSSQSHKGKPGSNTGKILINNGKITKYIFKIDLEYWLNLGWKRGKLPITDAHRKHLSEALKGKEISWAKGSSYYTNGYKEKRIFESDVLYYISIGWRKGRIKK